MISRYHLDGIAFFYYKNNDFKKTDTDKILNKIADSYSNAITRFRKEFSELKSIINA
jgi:hypothetical protein